MMTSTEQAFLALFRAGLWGTAVSDAEFADPDIDWELLLQMAREQTVVGLMADAMAQLSRGVVARSVYLQVLGDASSCEDRNRQMNKLVPVVFRTTSQLDTQAWLLKGQGIAQCYRNPLRRQSGDIDVFFPDANDYETARADFLTHLSSRQVTADTSATRTLEFDYKGFYIELHGHIVPQVNRRCDRGFARFLEACRQESPTTWNGATLPPLRFDGVFIFMHMVRHYFGGGIGLRQVADWMRLLQAHRDDLDRQQLEADLNALGLLKLWKAFGCMAVGLLGCPAEAMPFYEPRYEKQAARLLRYILESGNFGQYDARTKSSSRHYLVRRLVAFWGHLQMKLRNFTMFPEESIYGIPSFLADGLKRT